MTILFRKSNVASVPVYYIFLGGKEVLLCMLEMFLVFFSWYVIFMTLLFGKCYFSICLLHFPGGKRSPFVHARNALGLFHGM